MVLTSEDKKRLTADEQAKVQKYTIDWEKATNAEERKQAAALAAAVRAAAGYKTNADGLFMTDNNSLAEQSVISGKAAENAVSAYKITPSAAADGKYYAVGGSGKSFAYNAANGNIGITQNGVTRYITPASVDYAASYQAMQADTGLNFDNLSKQTQENQQAADKEEQSNVDMQSIIEESYQAAGDKLKMAKDAAIDKIISHGWELAVQAERKKEHNKQRYSTANSEEYANYMQEANPYGKRAEYLAMKGLDKSGYKDYTDAEFKRVFEKLLKHNRLTAESLKAEIDEALIRALAVGDAKTQSILEKYNRQLAALSRKNIETTTHYSDINTPNVDSNQAAFAANGEESGIPPEDGLYYFADETRDAAGNVLPRGSYIRILHGVEYSVLPGDHRYEKIAAEYAANRRAKY